LVTTGVAAACATPQTVVDGRSVSNDEAAQITLDRARQAEADGDLRTAESQYRVILDLYEGSSVEAKALAGLAEIKQAASGCDAARLYDERLIHQYGRSAEAEQARVRRRACTQVAGEPTSVDAPPTLLQAYEEASSTAEKKRIASEAADTALAGGDSATAALWLLEVHEMETDPASRRAVEDELEELVASRLTARGLRTLAERVKPGRFPHEILTFKLGRVQLHVEDEANGRETLNAYLDRYPQGRFVDDARRLLADLDARQPVEPRRLGVLLPMSGRHKNYGQLARQAIEMGLGPDSGIELVVRDTKSDPVAAAAGVRELVHTHHVMAILGPIFTYETLPAAFESQRLRVPVLTVSTADEVSKAGDFVFRNGISNRDQAKALVAYAMDVMGMKTFAILYPRHPYGEELFHAFWDEVDARQGEIRGVESYGLEDTTFSSQVKSIVARDDVERRRDYKKALEECDAQPDSYRKGRCRENVRKNLRPIIDFEGLFIPDYPRSISMISAALAFEDIIVEQDPDRLRVIQRTLGRSVKPVTLLGASGWNSPKLIERADRNVENAIFTDGFFADADDPGTRSFVARYRETHGRTPRLYPEALFYDSARILKSVFAQSPATRAEFRDRLRQVKAFEGVTGDTSFAGANDAQKTLRILTIQNGAIRLAPPDGPAWSRDPEAEPASGPDRPAGRKARPRRRGSTSARDVASPPPS
jgi:ABC-type branched-subunit amino acid transport system substrate-binding protein